MNETDLQLLQRFARDRAEDAFAELVQRHLTLVYSAALRQVQSSEFAQEVAQSVFLDLARNAGRLPATTQLTAWLFQVSRRTAIDAVRRETRRQSREKIAHELSDMNSPAATDWTEIEPLLDEAVQSLDDEDRAAVLLRYFSGKSVREVGEALGTSENAAQKRLARAVAQLSEFFTRRGVSMTSAALIASISANAAHAVPAGLGLAITAAVTHSAATAAVAATGIFTMNAMKTAAAAVVLLAAVTTGIYQSQRAANLETELAQAKAHPPLPPQFDQLSRERDEALRRLAAFQAETQRLGNSNLELMRLRDEVTRLRRDAQDSAIAKNAAAPTEAAAVNWLNRVTQLRSRLSQTPAAQIPELQLLTEEDWLAAVRQPSLETDEDYRRAFASLRNTAQSKFLASLLPALTRHLKASNGVFPTDLSELLAFWEGGPVDPAMLERYAIRPASEIPNVKVSGNWAITQKAPIDPQFDQRLVIGPHGFGNDVDLNDAERKTLEQASKAYAAANNGKEPLDLTLSIPEARTYLRRWFEDPRVEPYLTTPEARAAYAKFLKLQALRSNTPNSTVSK